MCTQALILGAPSLDFVASLMSTTWNLRVYILTQIPNTGDALTYYSFYVRYPTQVSSSIVFPVTDLVSAEILLWEGI